MEYDPSPIIWHQLEDSDDNFKFLGVVNLS